MGRKKAFEVIEGTCVRLVLLAALSGLLLFANAAPGPPNVPVPPSFQSLASRLECGACVQALLCEDIADGGGVGSFVRPNEPDVFDRPAAARPSG